VIQHECSQVNSTALALYFFVWFMFNVEYPILQSISKLFLDSTKDVKNKIFLFALNTLISREFLYYYYIYIINALLLMYILYVRWQ